MPIFDIWDIVKVPFPYTDRGTRQRRPALVIADPPAGTGELVWVLMITSAENRGWPGDVAIDGSGEAGLPAPSIVRTAKVACIDGRDVERLGTLPVGNRLEVSRQLRTSLATALRTEERAPS